MAPSPPADGDSSQQQSTPTASQKELELQRKRARDRKSQQAMRDRTKWTIHTLSEQVSVLSTALDQRARDVAALETRVGGLEAENAQLRTQNAALQLSLIGRDKDDEVVRQQGEDHAAAAVSPPGISPGSSTASLSHHALWEMLPNNTRPGCMADQILQGFVDTFRLSSLADKAGRFPLKPNLCSLLDAKHRSDDDISNVVADVLRTYREIESRPKQVAVFFVMATLLKVCQNMLCKTASWVIKYMGA